jgi:nitrogen-specific signal transduction histidine kinase/ActR/RegA family two-component response regulator
VLEVEISSHDLVFEGRPARIVAALDVTERHSLEAQLRHAQKMESVGRLAGGVAHDFNNMLSVILGYTGFALEAVRPGDPLHDDLKQVQSAAERAASLTRQLLAFSRKQVLSPEALDLNDVVRGLEDMLRRLLGEDVELELSLEEGLGSVKADRGQLEQAILNLAVNARDAMPQGGRLSIETADLELDAEHAAHHLGVTPGPYVLLALADTGCGMDEETRSRAFEPFFTTKAPGQGTGLGLAMVYGLVQQSAGSVWLYSEPGRGTVFKIYLPRVDAAVTVPGKRMPDNVERRGTETILIVEDEDAVRMAAERILLAAGYTVVSAANGGEALELCELNSDDIDLLLADVVMPQMSGRELADRVSGLWPNLKILYMSGYSDNALVHHGVLEPGTRLLAKPFTAEDLRRKVREVLDGAEP